MQKHSPILLIVLLCSLINCSSYAMEQAHTVAQPTALVPLKNGTHAPAQTVFNTHQTVIIATHNNAGFAIKELIETCRDTTKAISPEAGLLLQKYGLVNAENKPLPHLINIIISMAKGDGPNLKLVNPEKLVP